MIFEINDLYWALRMQIAFYKQNVKMFLIWMPFANVTVMDNER